MADIQHDVHHDHPVHEYHEHDGSGLGSVLATLLALLVIGFLLWYFVPAFGRNRTSNVNVNLNPTTGQTGGTGSTGGTGGTAY